MTTHRSTKLTAAQVIQRFNDGVNHLVLMAPTQSGKTSVYLTVAKMGVDAGMWTSVYVICNMADNDLKRQTQERYDEYGLEGGVMFAGELRGTEKVSDVQLLSRYGCGSLIIIDESHLGASRDQALSRFLGRLGVGPDGSHDDVLYHEDRPKLVRPRVISVSATPYAEISVLNQNKDIIFHTPGNRYISGGWYDRRGLVRDIPNHWQPVLKRVLRGLRRTRTYAIVRWGSTVNRVHDDIDKIVSDLGLARIEYDMGYSRDGGASMDDLVKVRPNQFTVILIKDYCTAGQTFTKRHISMVWETREDTDSQIQGLPGRCTGYLDDEELEAAKRLQIWCRREVINEHRNLYMNVYDGNIEQAKVTVPVKATNIKGHTMIGKLITDPRYQTFREYNSIEDVKADIPRMRDYFHESPIFMQQNGWYEQCPSFGVTIDGSRLTMDQATDERGFVHQYMGTERGSSKVWHIDEVKTMLNRIPHYNSAWTGFVHDGKSWKRGVVAKVCYRDLDDPSSIVFLVYSYCGPVVRMSEKDIHGVATHKSMYTDTVGITSYDKRSMTVIIPDNVPDTLMVERYRNVIMGSEKPIICVRESEAQDFELLGRLTYECATEAFDRLEWMGKCSPGCSILQPIIDERMMHIKKEEFSNKGDTIRFILKKLGATSEERAVRPQQITAFINAGLVDWKWSTKGYSSLVSHVSSVKVGDRSYRYYI